MPQALASRSRYCGSVLASLNDGVYAVAYGEEKIAEGRTQSTNRRYRHIDDKTPRGLWPLGLVTEVFAGPDGVVRSARVRHNETELHRPVVKLCLLEPELEDKECASETGRRAGDVPECKSEEASHPAAPQRHP